MKATVLFTGVSGAGKTTLCRKLLGLEGAAQKTQSAEYHAGGMVDLPGEFLSHPRMRTAYLASAQDAELVVFVQAADAAPGSIPAGLLQTAPLASFIGVISRTDLPEADMERSRAYLRELGIEEPYFETSVFDEASLESLRKEIARRGIATAGNRTEETA